jgi:hypothetical protein
MESLSKSDSKLNQSVFAASVKNAEVDINLSRQKDISKTNKLSRRYLWCLIIKRTYIYERSFRRR